LSSAAQSSKPKSRELRWNGYSGSKKYVYPISDDVLKRSPDWTASEQNPPLSARKALKLANEFADRALIAGPRRKREFSSLELTPARQNGKWLWIAVYEFSPNDGGSTGPIPIAYAIILMDGTVVKPEIIDDPNGGHFLLDDGE
jgi:hypothetical protein